MLQPAPPHQISPMGTLTLPPMNPWRPNCPRGSKQATTIRHLRGKQKVTAARFGWRETTYCPCALWTGEGRWCRQRQGYLLMLACKWEIYISFLLLHLLTALYAGCNTAHKVTIVIP
ncbi:hypothetical protein PVAP13_3KG569675 [Panicum virgatum]|uniref:Uncharacterized protein n=1 Tax=Panicum virgatum TaxID=38727 RepID=A0A8T0V2Y4_PANVG|nr:hypothetical protein PVAP13_3KG569675 [Panicum virgatum]